MSRLGWLDVGLEDRVLKTSRGDLYALGNERPWFTRQAGTGFRANGIREPSEKDLILAVSHSPDQWRWGRDEHAHLMLCGHTHGGQVRFPWIGPIIAPSHFGSRFASGVFELDSTLMHVSRGMAGVQPLRWGCLPEITVLELRSKKI